MLLGLNTSKVYPPTEINISVSAQKSEIGDVLFEGSGGREDLMAEIVCVFVVFKVSGLLKHQANI